MPSYGVRTRPNRARRVRRTCIRVNPHLAEVMTEAWLHESTRRLCERAPRRSQHLTHLRRHGYTRAVHAPPPHFLPTRFMARHAKWSADLMVSVLGVHWLPIVPVQRPVAGVL